MPPILTNCLLIFSFPFYYLPKQKEEETKDKGQRTKDEDEGRRTKDEEETKDEDKEDTKE